MTTLLATLDGELHPIEQPFLRADDFGVLRGDGVFETMLVRDGEIRDCPEHLQRLQRSAAMLDLDLPDPEYWQKGLDAVVGQWAEPGEYIVRCIGTRGLETGSAATCFVLASACPPATLEQRSGIRIRLLERGFSGPEVVRMPWLLPGAKSISYAINMAAVRHAKSRGADDAVFVGTDGRVLEGPTSNVVIEDGNTLLTPPLDGVLDGITVSRLLRAAEAAGWQVRRGDVSPEDLRTAPGAYLTSSVRLLAPIVAVDDTERAPGPRAAELTRLLV